MLKLKYLFVFAQVSSRRRRTVCPNWSSWTLWASCASETSPSTSVTSSRWSCCCWRRSAGTCACPHLPTSSTTTSTLLSMRETYTTAGPSPPCPRPKPSWTNTHTTSLRCPLQGVCLFFCIFYLNVLLKWSNNNETENVLEKIINSDCEFDKNVDCVTDL